MNTKMKFLRAPALALIFGAGLWAQATPPSTPPATKVALINMQVAIANTKDGQAQIEELKKKYDPKEAEFQKRGADLQAKQDQLKKTQNTISDEARASQEAEITKLKTNLQRDIDDAQSDSQADQQKMIEGIYGKLVQIATKVAQDNQIMLVFDVSSQPNNLVCCGSAPDITKDVVALYDKTNSPGAAAAAPTASKPAATPPPASRPASTPPARPAAPAK